MTKKRKKVKSKKSATSEIVNQELSLIEQLKTKQRKMIITTKGNANPWSFRINILLIGDDNSHNLIYASPILNLETDSGFGALIYIFRYYMLLGKIKKDNLIFKYEYKELYTSDAVNPNEKFTIVNENGDIFKSNFIIPDFVEVFEDYADTYIEEKNNIKSNPNFENNDELYAHKSVIQLLKKGLKLIKSTEQEMIYDYNSGKRMILKFDRKSNQHQ